MKEYQKPDFRMTEYDSSTVIAMSWSDEETGEALVGTRNEKSDDEWEGFWKERE